MALDFSNMNDTNTKYPNISYNRLLQILETDDIGQLDELILVQPNIAVLDHPISWDYIRKQAYIVNSEYKIDLVRVAMLYKARKCIQRLISLTDINKVCTRGETLLHYAINMFDVQTIQTLLSDNYIHKINKDARDINHDTVLHLAAKIEIIEIIEIENSHLLDIIKLLLDNSFSVHALNSQKNKPVHLIRFSQCPKKSQVNKQILELFLQRGILIDELGRNNCSILQFAIRNCDILCTEYLIGKGADVNISDIYLSTVLHDAVTVNSYELVDLLIRHGANVSMPASDLNYPIHMLKATSDSDFNNNYNYSYKYQTQVKSPEYENHIAFKILLLLEENGASLLVTGKQGSSLVHICARRGLDNILEYLIEKNHDLTPLDHFGDQPIHDAVFSGRLTILRRLLNCGVPIDTETNAGLFPPLHLAIRRNMVDCARLLIDNGADIHRPNSKGKTAGEIAVLNNTLEALELFYG